MSLVHQVLGKVFGEKWDPLITEFIIIDSPQLHANIFVIWVQ